ncbi:hypothetical protein ANRL1_04839 [Anaerolineae bacterium]|nr:hypothetical protein ANRL1_04839 [Anaerolineae bacterium]
MGNYKLELKVRKSQFGLAVSFDELKAILDMPAESGKTRLWDYFSPVSKFPKTKHDREWLELIVNWMPVNEGATRVEPPVLTETAKWFSLIAKLNRLDESDQERTTVQTVVLNQREVDLIWSRVRDPKFKITEAVNPNFVTFLTEFMAVAKLHFAEVPDEPEEPDEKGEA